MIGQVRFYFYDRKIEDRHKKNNTKNGATKYSIWPKNLAIGMPQLSKEMRKYINRDVFKYFFSLIRLHVEDHRRNCEN